MRHPWPSARSRRLTRLFPRRSARPFPRRWKDKSMPADVNSAVDTGAATTVAATTVAATTVAATTVAATTGAGSGPAEQAIIEAALALFAESGVEGLCIEQVAARAGVGKATIYRRWPGKEDLLLDALASLKTPLPEPGGLSVREDLIALLEAMSTDTADP